MTDYKLKVTLKYCGSCNPLIDLIQIGNKLKEAIENAPELQRVSPDDDPIDVVVILCGCPRKCGDKESFHKLAAHSIVIAGGMVDLMPTAEKDIPEQVMQKLESFSSPES
ncbi:hypothetical protein ES703_69303 [subsurface metagenome]|nr:hypothetical protein [Dehalococcoidia bacterium]